MIQFRIFFFYLLTIYIKFSFSQNETNTIKPFWPLEIETENAIVKNILCDTCQIVSELAETALTAYEKKKNFSKKGMLDVAIMEITNPEHLCTVGYLKHYSEMTDYNEDLLVKTCKDIIDENEEKFEEVVFRFYKEPQSIASNLCISTYCKELWSELDKPENREPLKKKNIRYSKEFLEWNNAQEEIVTLDSGLQYKKLNKNINEGTSPSINDQVKVHYEGKTLNGKTFDSSYERNEPATIPLNQVIPGWNEGLQLMKEGDHFQFFIPPNLGYGEFGAGDKIGPNELLVFDVNLLKIEPLPKIEPSSSEF